MFKFICLYLDLILRSKMFSAKGGLFILRNKYYVSTIKEGSVCSSLTWTLTW